MNMIKIHLVIETDFFRFHNLLLFSNESHPGWLFLFKFEITQYKNLFNINLVKIHSSAIEILSFPCFALF